MPVLFALAGDGLALKQAEPNIKSITFARKIAPVIVSLRRLITLLRQHLWSRLWNSRAPNGPESSLVDRAFLFAKRALILFFFTSFTSALFYRFIPVALTPLIILRAGEAAAAGKAPRWHKRWVPIEAISRSMQAAVIASEDEYFFEHNGVDWRAVEKAMEHNLRSDRTRGASTISQQVAKNVFLWPDRSWIRKGLELYFTGLIEALWSKERILEVYLNVVELGDGTYGVEAASMQFFNKHASKLNADESALLAAVLPNPRKLLVLKPSGYVRFRQSLIRRRLSRF